MTKKNETMYSYYESRDILPTYAQLNDPVKLQKYTDHRATFLSDILSLPLAVFKDADMIEFGPDSGENALVFAGWGANMTLIEPNPKPWPLINGYFETFGRKSKLKSIEKVSIEECKSDLKFKFAIAEGFIYTVKPHTLWINKFAELLENEGIAIISYYEIAGGAIELLTKAIHRRGMSLLGGTPLEVAERLYSAKWTSVPHTRAFESWVMDVMENPFVRLKYFISAEQICKEFLERDMTLYSSWPNYKDALEMRWHKKEVTHKYNHQRNVEFISRSTLSFLFGRKAFISSQSMELVTKASEAVTKLVTGIDGLIDDFNKSTSETCIKCLDEIAEIVSGENVLYDSVEDKAEVIGLVESMRHVFQIMMNSDAAALEQFCQSDSHFIKNWGLPNHYAVFKKN
jgi:hypothetical protein